MAQGAEPMLQGELEAWLPKKREKKFLVRKKRVTKEIGLLKDSKRLQDPFVVPRHLRYELFSKRFWHTGRYFHLRTLELAKVANVVTKTFTFQQLALQQ